MIKGFSDVIDFFLHLLQRLSDKCSAQQWKSWEQRHPSQYGSQSLRLWPTENVQAYFSQLKWKMKQPVRSSHHDSSYLLVCKGALISAWFRCIHRLKFNKNMYSRRRAQFSRYRPPGWRITYISSLSFFSIYWLLKAEWIFKLTTPQKLVTYSMTLFLGTSVKLGKLANELFSAGSCSGSEGVAILLLDEW